MWDRNVGDFFKDALGNTFLCNQLPNLQNWHNSILLNNVFGISSVHVTRSFLPPSLVLLVTFSRWFATRTSAGGGGRWGMCCPGYLANLGQPVLGQRTSNVHIEGPGVSNTTKIQREDLPRRREKKRNGGKRGKKSANFWPFGAPTLRSAHPSRRSSFWAPLSLPHPPTQFGQNAVKSGWPWWAPVHCGCPARKHCEPRPQRQPCCCVVGSRVACCEVIVETWNSRTLVIVFAHPFSARELANSGINIGTHRLSDFDVHRHGFCC